MIHFKSIHAGLYAIAVLAMPFAANAESITYSGTFNAEDPTFAVTAISGTWTAVVDDSDFLMLTGVGEELVVGTVTSLTMSPSPLGSTTFDTTNTGFLIDVFNGDVGAMTIGGLAHGVQGVSLTSGVADWFANYFPGTNFSANGAPLDGIAAEAVWTTGLVNEFGDDSNHGGTISTINDVGPFALTAPCVDDQSLACAVGIVGVTISGLSYDVDFVLDSYNATYSGDPPLFQGDPAFVASNAVAAALSSFDGIFGVIGKGSIRSQILVPFADFGGDTASAMFLVCSFLDASGCTGWVNSFASIISKSTVTDGPDIYGAYARFRLSDSGGANQPPSADAGVDQAVRAGDIVFLDGSASFDDNTATASLEYAWSFVSLPAGSTATLTAVNTATPSFVVDVAGTYAIQLVVTDEGGLPSPPDEVIISSDNLAPTANAGPDELVIVGSTVLLDGNGSADPEGNPITHSWAMSSAPVGSTALLIDANTTSPSFAPDLEGAYEVTLVVSDFIGPGAPDSVNITAVSSDQFAVIKIVAAGETIAALTPTQVTTQGNQNALMNFLTQATVAIQVGDLAEAINKLQKALSRTDGCVIRGAPDGSGGGRDWVTICSDQTVLYEALNLALDALLPDIGTAVFDISGEYSFVVPAGVSTLTIRAWGAGGGGWNGNLSSGFGFGVATGGTGGFVEGILPVVPGDTLVVIVGKGGREASCVGATPGAGGGGLAGVLEPGNAPLVVAGGGGGATRQTDGCDAALPCPTSTPYMAGGSGFGGPGQASNSDTFATDGTAGVGAPNYAGGAVGLGNCGTTEGFGGFGGGGGGGGTHSGFAGGGGGGGFPGGFGGAKREPGFGGSNFTAGSVSVLTSNANGSTGGSPNADGTAADGSDGRVEIDH